jgi:hypothetical protein
MKNPSVHQPASFSETASQYLSLALTVLAGALTLITLAAG